MLKSFFWIFFVLFLFPISKTSHLINKLFLPQIFSMIQFEWTLLLLIDSKIYTLGISSLDTPVI